MSYKHICGSCKKTGCPDAGNEKYDGMVGPCIMCQEYKPPLWSLDCFIRGVIVFGMLAVILCAIHAIITR